MEQAHQAGIIHRDLKPGNVLLAPAANDPALNCAWGWPKLTDFGLARRMEGAGMTRSGAVMGTPNYMAPEQANGQIDKLGPAVDVYGLGGILYRLLTGQHPFRDANRHTAPPSPRSLHTSVPEKLSILCMRCLATTPADRPSVADLIKDLEQFLSGDPVTGPTVGAAQPAERLAVMISSTSLDLPQHRDTVNEAIRRVGYYPLAMEHGSAEAGSNALSFSLRMVEQADLFIGIIAFRYGYVPADPIANPNGWSVTEHEYRRAMEQRNSRAHLSDERGPCRRRAAGRAGRGGAAKAGKAEGGTEDQAHLRLLPFGGRATVAGLAVAVRDQTVLTSGCWRPTPGE